MNTTPNTDFNNASDIDRLARRRVGVRLGWLTHATVYLLVMGGLTAMALWQGRHPPVAAAFGWGLGLAIHGLRVFVAGKGSALRERLVDAERQRLVARRGA
ncbi:2TM domain-containing protein [Hydrogenophaga flava]|uniref:2TM domain-containing protein n=1 Tax=Hydrogenophaga flava TaxID=65657 RepID=UPI000826EA5A|nr:2TM domain-containing protein [Hydrogenophaga flava]